MQMQMQMQLAMANPGTEVAQKLNESGLMGKLGQEWFFVTVGEAVDVCSSRLHPEDDRIVA